MKKRQGRKTTVRFSFPSSPHFSQRENLFIHLFIVRSKCHRFAFAFYSSPRIQTLSNADAAPRQFPPTRADDLAALRLRLAGEIGDGPAAASAAGARAFRPRRRSRDTEAARRRRSLAADADGGGGGVRRRRGFPGAPSLARGCFFLFR